MKNHPLLICFYFLCLQVNGQGSDSPATALGRMSDTDTSKVNALNEAGKSYWMGGDDSLAVMHLHEAIRLARQLHFYQGEARARLQLARIELDYLSDVKTLHNHLDSVVILAKLADDKLLEGLAIFRRAQAYGSGFLEHEEKTRPLYEEARKIFVELGNKNWEGSVYTQLAEFAGNEGNYAEAIDLLLKARKLQEASGEAGALRATLPNLGVMYVQMGMFREALQCFDDAEKTAIALNDDRVRAFLYSQRSEIYKKQDEPQAALQALKKGIALYESSGGGYYLPGNYARLGDIYLSLDSVEKALHYSLLADNLYKSQVDAEEALLHPSQIMLGKVYLKKGDLNRVIAYATEGLNWASSSDPVLLLEAAEYHHQLSEAYERTGRLKDALYHHKHFKSMSDTLLNAQSLQKSTISSLTYDFEKKQQTDKLRIQELENEKLLQSRNILIGLLLLGVLVSLYALWSNRRLRTKNQELFHKNQEIEKALHKGQKIERKRVASELHDNLNTKLAAIRWHLESMQTEGFNAFNTRIHSRLVEMTNDVYKDVRLISHNMLPTELETDGLPAALQKLVSKFEDNTVDFQLVVRNINSRFPTETEHQLYNIALELVNNVIKHAQATTLRISLDRDNSDVTLSVIDNGVGMPVTTLSDGMGMRNIINRAESLQGSATIENLTSGGTRVSVTIPL